MNKALFFFFASSLCFASGGETLWLKGVSVLDPGTKKIKKIDLSLRGGRVHRAPVPKVIPKGDRVLDLAGRFIIPGLYDMHAHVTFGNPGPGGVRQTLTPMQVTQLALLAGVTGILDLSADEDVIFAARAESRREKNGADLFVAGPMVTCPGGHGSDLGYPTRTVSNPKEAEKEINDLAKRHPDIVKLAMDHAGEESAPKPVMDFPTLQAVIRTAKKHHLKTVVHIGNWDDARQAILAGADIITHLYEIDIPDSLVQLMKEKKIIEIPTMTYQTEFLHILENRTLLGAPLLSLLLPRDVLAAYRTMDPEDSYSKRILDWQARGRDSYPKSLAKLVRAKIPLFAGTDSGDLGTVYGYSVHREMMMFVEAGATPWDALASASTLPKKFLGRSSGVGEGDVADLVVLKSNPLTDIANTQTIEMVFHNGKMVEDSKELATTAR